MRSESRMLFAVLVVASGVAGSAQEPDARTVLQASLKAMGGDSLHSIVYSGTEGYVGEVGQNYSPAHDWPALDLTRYMRTIDYDARSSKEEYAVRSGIGQVGPTGSGAPRPVSRMALITTPFVGEQRRNWIVRGNYAWDLQDTALVPQPALAEQRQLEIWLTPHGCLKAALASEANPVAIERNEHNGGHIIAVSFMALGKYRVQCSINSRNLVERVQTWIANPVVGDLYYEILFHDYKDFGGVMFPTEFHAHQGLDDDIEGPTNVSGGHHSFELTIASVLTNVSGAAPVIPDAVRTATVPPVRIESQKIGDGVWYVGGGALGSVAVEFRDHITIVEAPLNEARSLAVIREVRKLIPNKPIRYLVSTHHHWDQIGGLRAYVAEENVTIVMQQNNQAYYAEVLSTRPWSVQADRLALFPPEEVLQDFTFESVGQKHVLSDGARTIEIYNVQDLAHALGMLMVYLPEEKMVIETDLFTPPATNVSVPTMVNASNRTFYNNVQRLKLDVRTIVPIEGGRTFPWAEFAKLVTSANAKTN